MVPADILMREGWEKRVLSKGQRTALHNDLLLGWRGTEDTEKRVLSGQ